MTHTKGVKIASEEWQSEWIYKIDNEPYSIYKDKGSWYAWSESKQDHIIYVGTKTKKECLKRLLNKVL